MGVNGATLLGHAALDDAGDLVRAPAIIHAPVSWPQTCAHIHPPSTHSTPSPPLPNTGMHNIPSTHMSPHAQPSVKTLALGAWLFERASLEGRQVPPGGMPSAEAGLAQTCRPGLSTQSLTPEQLCCSLCLCPTHCLTDRTLLAAFPCVSPCSCPCPCLGSLSVSVSLRVSAGPPLSHPRPRSPFRLSR